MTIFLLLAVPLFAAALSAFVPRGRQRIIERVALVAALAELMLAFLVAKTVLAGTLSTPQPFQTDALGAFILLLATTVGLGCTMHSLGHLREEMRKKIIGFSRIRQYYALFHLFFFAMFAAAATSSPLIMWVAIEATTLATAFLISFYNKPSSVEAGWKHLIINSVGLLIGFLGTLLFLNAAAAAGSHEVFVSWSTLHDLHGSFNPQLIKVAFIFVLIGYGTKVGLVPMHTWLPDAHSKAPVPISSLLSGVLLNVALIAVLRFRSVTDLVLDPSFTQSLLILFGTNSVVVAALIIFGQKNYKRMLAYSSIEHMGVMALGFAIGGAGIIAALFHMMYHAFLKTILFFSAGNIFLKYSSTKVASVRGALTLVPFSAVLFFGALVAASGIPPSGIFFTKLAILSAGMQQFPYLMLLILTAFTVVFAGFVMHAARMLFGEAPDGLNKGEPGKWTFASLGFLTAIFITLSVWVPAPLYALITEAARAIQ